MERSHLVSHYHLSFTHPFNQVDIAVFVELLSIFMKDLRLRIWTWLESIVLVKLAYYAPSTAQNLRNLSPSYARFSKLCSWHQNYAT